MTVLSVKLFFSQIQMANFDLSYLHEYLRYELGSFSVGQMTPPTAKNELSKKEIR